ncbi:MAG: phosphotransferase [Anaerolineae bacterium]
MLEKPNIPDQKIIEHLRKEYGLQLKTLTHLPIGADSDSAVYRAEATDQTAYFLKLRSGPFDETSVTLLKHYHDLGISQIIACIPTQMDQLWGEFGRYKTMLYPFIEGKNGYEQTLSDRNWAEFGHALKQIHTADIPASIKGNIRRESFSAEHRNSVRGFLNQIEQTEYADPVARELAAFLKVKRPVVLDLIGRTEALAHGLKAQPFETIVCHSDLHAGNLLISPDDSLFIVDWDAPILAPKERDLMYIGGALLSSGISDQAEEFRFYNMYGEINLNEDALVYYRCERIIEDISEYCKELLLSDAGGADRHQSLAYLKSNFEPNRTLYAALRL